MSFASVATSTAAAVALAMLVMWGLSLLLRDASIVDIFWGLGFILVAAVASRADGSMARKLLVGDLVTLWGARLAIHLFLRNVGKGEDARYRAMRRRWGKRFPLISLVTVFALQGVLMWVVSLPVQVSMASPTPKGLTLIDGIGTVVWIAGFAFETIGDLQLTRFKRDPTSAGRMMDRGLWRYTRHPNYFGDALQWWGFGIICLATPGHRWALLGPLVMNVLLLRVSGVALLERRMARTRPGYEDYARRTSAFIPRPQRRST